MGLVYRRRVAIAASVLLSALSASGGAHAEGTLIGALESGTPLIDIRTRYEAVGDDNCGACTGLDADARTMRARLGYTTGEWNGLSVAFAFDQIWALGPEDYNSKTNGRTAYPVVADPTMTALDRLTLTYKGDFGSTITAGRQVVILDNARFIGNVGFRQHEQSFDAVKLVNTSLPHTTLTYAWIGGVNRVFGPENHAAGHFTSNSHVLNASYTGIAGLKLTAYAYLLDLKQAEAASTATYGLRAQYKMSMGDGVSAGLTGEFAHQSDYAENPLSISLDYWALSGQVKAAGFMAAVGYEAMEGNGTVGFATPLATLHAFDGWADLFLGTPKVGIDDLYAKVSYNIPHAFGFVALVPLLIYHSFTADRTGTSIGKEWDTSLTAVFDKHISLNLSYADYSGAGAVVGGFRDKAITWLTATFKY